MEIHIKNEYEWRPQSPTSGEANAEHKDSGSSTSDGDDNNEISTLGI